MLTDGDSSLAPLVPRAATRAARGDVGEIASVLADAGQPGACVGFQPKCEPGLSLGVYLSAMCRDEVPFVDPSQLAASVAGHPGLVEAYGNPPILDDCRAWNVPPAPAWMHEAVTSPVPTLVFSGGYDSYSDPGIDRRAVEDLSNASVVVIPYFGHNVLGTSQAISIRNAWLDQPTARPDTSSLGAIRPPSFEIR
jgi:pimeloyl-ACP methyl ester carboxylesterase